MFSSLSKLWGSSSSSNTRSEREQRSTPTPAHAGPPTTPTTLIPSTNSESKPLPPPPVSLHQLSRSTSFGSAHTLEKFRTTGPSHVSWRTPTPSASATSVSGTGGSPSVTPSPSRPNFQSTTSLDVVYTRAEPPLEDPTNTPTLKDGIWRIPPSVANAVLGTGTPPSPVGTGSGAATPGSRRLSGDSVSLHLQSIYLSDTDSTQDVMGAGNDSNGARSSQALEGRLPSKLSPIAESGSSPNESANNSKVLGSPGQESEKSESTIKRYSDPFATPTIPIQLTPNSSSMLTASTPTQTPTTPMTPMQPTPTTPVQHQAFLTRTVKRSISQSSSTGTFFTPVSAIPPSSILTGSVHSHGHSPVPQTPVSTTTTGTMATTGHIHASSPPSPSPSTPSTPKPPSNNNVMKPYLQPTQARAATPPTQPADTRPYFSSSGSLPFPAPPTFQFPYPSNTRRVHLAAPPSLPTVLGSPPVTTRALPILDVEIEGQPPYPHTTVSVIYEGSERQRESVATSMERRSLGTGRWRESGPGRWRDSGKSATSFFTAPSAASMHFENGDETEEDVTGDGEGQSRARQSEYSDHTRNEDSESQDREHGDDSGVRTDDESWTYGEELEYADHEQRSPEEYDGGDSQSHMSLPEGYCDVINERPLSHAASSSGVLGSRGNSNDDGTGTNANTQANARPAKEREKVLLGEERVRSWASELMHVPLDAGDDHDIPNHEDGHPYPYDVGNDGETMYTRRSSTFADDHQDQELFDRPNGHARVHSDGGSSILETMERHENGSVLTDSDATAVEQRIQARWFEARGVSWGSFRSFRDSLYVYTRTRWGRRGRRDLERMQTDKNAAGPDPDFEFGVDKLGQDIEWGKRGGTGRVRWGFAHNAESSASRANSTSPACVLFWLGFVAPWCWLIAGWCLSVRSGQMKETEGQYVWTVDRRAMWWPRRSPAAQTTTTTKRVKRRRAPENGDAQEKSSLGWIRRLRGGTDKITPGAPSSNGLTLPTHSHAEGVSETSPMTPVDPPSTDSGDSLNALYSFHLSPDGSVVQSKKVRLDNHGVEDEESLEVKTIRVVDPWVRRCRIAAITSGIVLSIAVVVIVVAVVVSRR